MIETDGSDIVVTCIGRGGGGRATPEYGLFERICRWWCRHFHRSITLPVNGQYFCMQCTRSYEVGYR